MKVYIEKKQIKPAAKKDLYFISEFSAQIILIGFYHPPKQAPAQPVHYPSVLLELLHVFGVYFLVLPSSTCVADSDYLPL